MEALSRGSTKEQEIRELDAPTAPALVAETLKGIEALEGLEPDWDELADRAAAPAHLRARWFLEWWRAFGRGRLEIITVRRDGRLVGVVPMQRRSGELRSLSNYHTPSFGLLASDQNALHALAAALMRTSPRRLTVAFVPEEDASLDALEAARRAAGRSKLVRVLERCPYLTVQGTYHDLLTSRGGNLRRGLPRRRRRLEAQGVVEFEVRDGRNDLDRLLEEGFAVEGSGWKGANGTAIASSPATRAFYTKVARWLAGRGALRLGFLRLDGKAVAFEFCIEEGGRHLSLKSGYDEAHRSDGPGVLLRSAMLERVFECRLQRYDFLGTDEDWKMAWTSQTEVQVQFQAFRRSPDAAADWAAQRYLRPLARRLLKRRPPRAPDV